MVLFGIQSEEFGFYRFLGKYQHLEKKKAEKQEEKPKTTSADSGEN